MICPNCKHDVKLKKYCTNCGYQLHSVSTTITSSKIFDSKEDAKDFFMSWVYVILFIVGLSLLAGVVCCNL